MDSSHTMVTRSKKVASTPPNDDIDEHGNISGLIDYECDADLDRTKLNEELYRLSNGRILIEDLKLAKNDKSDKSESKKKKPPIVIEEVINSPSPKKSKKNKPIKKAGSQSDLSGILMSYILSKANEQLKKKPKKKKGVIKIELKEKNKAGKEEDEDSEEFEEPEEGNVGNNSNAANSEESYEEGELNSDEDRTR